MFGKFFTKWVGDYRNDPTSLRNLFISHGWMTAREADDVRDFTTEVGGLCGEAMVKLGLISQQSLEDALMQQRAVRGQVPIAKAIERQIEVHAATQATLEANLAEVADLTKAVLAKEESK